MAKQNAMVSGAGWIGSFVTKLSKALRKKSVSDEQIHELVRDGEVSDALVERVATVLAEDICNRSKESAPKRTYKVLRPVAPEPTAPRPFKADETFFNKKSGVRMGQHGDNFTRWFSGKEEEDVPEGNLQWFVLTQNAYVRDIIADLGGEEKAETMLAEIWRLMQRQASGEDGALSTNGWANIFFVRDTSGVLRTVSVNWDRIDGWCVFADGLGSYVRELNFRIFSRSPRPPRLGEAR